jgi:hypothetical protein
MDPLTVFVILALVVVAGLLLFTGWLLFWPSKRGPLKSTPGVGGPPRAPAAPTIFEQMRANREATARARAEAQARIVCQFCGEAGHVTARMVQRKHGVSGGKATAALLTGGVSLVAVGLSRKGYVTRLTCSNCRMSWDVG